VADFGNHRIEEFNVLGAYITQWGSNGSGAGQFVNPSGVATDLASNVYVTDSGNNRVQKFTRAGAYLTQWGSFGSAAGLFKAPTGLAIDAEANLYVADRDNHRIQKFSSAGLAPSEGPGSYLLTFDPAAWGPTNLASDAGGNIYVADQASGYVMKFNSVGAYLGQWGSFLLGNRFTILHGLAADAAGNVFAIDQGQCRIEKYASDGTYLTSWGTQGSGPGQLAEPIAGATDAAGNVYIVDQTNCRIVKFTGAGVFLTQWGSFGSGIGQFNHPQGAALDASGNVYVVDYSNHRIEKFTGAGTFLTQWGTQGSGNGQFQYPEGVAVDGSGNVYVSDSGNYRIQRFTSNGAYLSQWGSQGTGNGQFDNLAGLATDPAGNVYAADAITPRIQKFVIPPALTYVSDVSGDFGGQVTVRFRPTSAEAAGAGATIDHYEVYREIEPHSGFVLMGSAPASGASEYAVNAATLADAGPGSLMYSTYVVQAVAAGNTAFYGSGLDDGFSIANLPTTDVPSAPRVAFALEGALPNPARGGRFRIGFTLPSNESARLEVIDVTGRRARICSVGALGAGRHVVDLSDGLKPGLYFLRLTQGTRTLATRATLID